MWFSAIPAPSFALAALLLAQQTTAALIPELLHNLDIFNTLEKRCTNPCGYYGQLCCASNQYCYTDANGQAACGTGSQPAAQSGGSWQYVTTTYVQTDLKTVVATYSTYIPAVTQAPTGQQCSYSQGQSACGSTCCMAGYYCKQSNMCVAVPGGSSGYYSNLYTVTTVITNTAGVPLRPTTQTILTLTQTGVTGTTAFQSPVGTGGAILGASSSSGGLSGGAIAGIVIGVIIGVIILLLICACCCFKGLIDGLLSIFGLGPRRKKVTEEVVVEERRRTGHGTWFGFPRPGRRTSDEVIVEEEKKSSGFGRAAGVAAFLGATAAFLGLKRRYDRREEKYNSSYGSYYSYSDYTSDSSPSSITRTSRRSRSHR